MSENKKHIKQYSAEDIQRYLKGHMSAQEMHAIETAALDDPFLADAIEGFEMAIAGGNEELINKDLNELKNKFSKGSSYRTRVVPINRGPWWQIAAAAMILFTIGLAIYNNRPEPGDTGNALAINEKKKTDTSRVQQPEQERSSALSTFMDTQNIPDKKIPPVTSEPSKDIASAPVSSKDETGSKNQNKYEDSKDDRVTQTIERADKRKEESFNKPPAAENNNINKQPSIASSGNSEIKASRNNELADQINNFSGRVVDPNNNPLANASLQVLQNRTSLVTDQSGTFNFSARDTVVDIQVGLVGFEQRNFRLKNSISPSNLVLEPAKQNLDEVVVSGYGNRRKKDVTKATVKVQDAVPQIGWIEYEKYLENNKKSPDANPLMKGEVVVSFQVKRPAVLSDYKIEKSLSADYDAEAIRLIREGPGWKLLHGYRTRITVIVKF